MAAVEKNTGSANGDQQEEMSPSGEGSPPLLDGTLAPLNFSELTPRQFGISVQSFTSASSLKCKDKSRLAQIKARRRSTIGARGSPETQSLICFMAKHRMKTPPTLKSHEVASTLGQKMATFQNLMDVEKSEGCDPMPEQDSITGGCIKTRDYLSDGNISDGEKENRPSLMTPTKRRRLGPLETCKLEIRENGTPIHRFKLEEQEEKGGPVTPLRSSETVEEAQAVLLSPPRQLHACSPLWNQQDRVFELQSPGQVPPYDPASPAQPASSFRIPSLFSQLEMKPTGEDDSIGKSTVKSKKKSVRFGGRLSPEFFDKNLPPSTPLQKGATPTRAPTPGGIFQLRSLLKTPQRTESQAPPAQPDLSSPTEFWTSTAHVMRGRLQSVGGGHEEEVEGKLVFPSMEETDSEVTCDTEFPLSAEPLNLNTAFHEESLSQILTESETKPGTASPVDELTSIPEQPEANIKAPAKIRNRRKKHPGPESDGTSEAPARPRGQKRKQLEESEPVKRSSRSAAKSASGKIKTTSIAARQWSRDVDRSLYQSRIFASKDPTLSPITESLPSVSPSPDAEQTPSTSCTAPDHVPNMNPEISIDSPLTRDPTVTNTLENPSGDPITPSSSSHESAAENDRTSGSTVRGRRLPKRKVSVAEDILLSENTQDQDGGITEEHYEDQTTARPEASRERPLSCSDPEQGGNDTEVNARDSAYTQNTDSDGALDRHVAVDAPTADCNKASSPPSEPTRRKAKRGRRRSANRSVLQEQTEEHLTSHEVEEKVQQENIKSCSESQKDARSPGLNLAPWQADFNFEDVFKPVATRAQSSVRRSLRNLSNAEPGSSCAGLAWMPRTSPESKGARRRTRGQRLSAASLVQPPLPEETRDDVS